ncbi:MAG: aminotransferase class I/II-fold pyridoxal phosphate-dependent enzyme, partial [Firmicutes bacterium]|nr:aminotransferase class I/II-fold pyridoxal phosphate-dependent enzyme [Bacillota bacterium]
RTIIEDDFESEFSTSSKAEDTVFSLAKRGNVIYLNTFSKTVAPSIRAGYMILPEELLPLYRERAGFYSCAVPTFEQYALAEFIENGDFERHINRVRRAARKKLQDARSSEGTRK